MRIFTACKISLCSFAFLANSNAFGWWDQAHELVGYIAGNNVTSETHDKVLQLLKTPIDFPGNAALSANTSDFDTAAVWADSIKAYTDQMSKQDHKLCHYIDLTMDKSLVGTVMSDAAAHSAFNTAMTEYKINSVSCLSSAIKSLMDPTQTAVQQAIALRFVIHIMGDMTQPLHNISLVDKGSKDDGGNKTLFPTAVWIPATNGSGSSQTKLHAIWDATLGAFLQFPYNKEESKKGFTSASDRALTANFSKKLEAQKRTQDIFNATIESNQTIEDWVIDGYRVAAKEVYTDLNATWGVYSVARYDTVSMQIAKGGYRLAFLLDAIFDSANSPIAFQNIVYSIKNDRTITPFQIK